MFVNNILQACQVDVGVWLDCGVDFLQIYKNVDFSWLSYNLWGPCGVQPKTAKISDVCNSVALFVY